MAGAAVSASAVELVVAGIAEDHIRAAEAAVPVITRKQADRVGVVRAFDVIIAGSGESRDGMVIGLIHDQRIVLVDSAVISVRAYVKVVAGRGVHTDMLAIRHRFRAPNQRSGGIIDFQVNIAIGIQE